MIAAVRAAALPSCESLCFSFLICGGRWFVSFCWHLLQPPSHLWSFLGTSCAAPPHLRKPVVRLVYSLLAAFFCASACWPVVCYSLFLTDFRAYLTRFLSVLDVEFFSSLFFFFQFLVSNLAPFPYYSPHFCPNCVFNLFPWF